MLAPMPIVSDTSATAQYRSGTKGPDGRPHIAPTLIQPQHGVIRRIVLRARDVSKASRGRAGLVVLMPSFTNRSVSRRDVRLDLLAEVVVGARRHRHMVMPHWGRGPVRWATFPNAMRAARVVGLQAIRRGLVGVDGDWSESSATSSSERRLHRGIFIGLRFFGPENAADGRRQQPPLLRFGN